MTSVADMIRKTDQNKLNLDKLTVTQKANLLKQMEEEMDVLQRRRCTFEYCSLR